MKKIFTFLFVFNFTLAAFAQSTVELVTDVNPGTGSSYASNFTELNGMLYFAADNGTLGNELFKTDGTLSSLVKDILAGSSSSNPNNFFAADSILFFSASDPATGNELYKTNGTSNGTILLKNINPSGHSYPRNFIKISNSVVFTADDGSGRELWVSDGTASGTIKLIDINPTGGNLFNEFRMYNNKLYFTADNGVAGKEIWVSDGTTSGTLMLKDINSGASDGSPNRYTVFNNKLYFLATTAAAGYELWVSDGTSVGTQMLIDIIPGAVGAMPLDLGVCNGKLFFSAETAAHGRELWLTDGTPSGTIMVKDIKTGTVGSYINQDGSIGQAMHCFDNKVYFSAIADTAIGNELFVSNGTTSGTGLFKEFSTGSDDSWPQVFNNFNNKMYLLGRVNSGWQLIESDGTSANTVIVAPPIATDPSPLSNGVGFIEYKGDLYFRAKFTTQGHEPWRIVGSHTAIYEHNITSSLKYFPNPASTQLFVESDNATQLYFIDILGRNAKQINISEGQQSIDISDLQEGVYFLNNEEGKCLGKIIKK